MPVLIHHRIKYAVLQDLVSYEGLFKCGPYQLAQKNYHARDKPSFSYNKIDLMADCKIIEKYKRKSRLLITMTFILQT